MTERDWEEVARSQLERAVADTVRHLRRVADRIEIEAKSDINDAQTRTLGNYAQVAASVVHEVTWGLANANLGNLINVASEAQMAKEQKIRARGDEKL